MKKASKKGQGGRKTGKVKYQKGEFAGNPGAAFVAARFGEFDPRAVALLDQLLRLREAGLPLLKDRSALGIGTPQCCLANVVEILFTVIASRNAKVLRDVAVMIERRPDEPVQAAADPVALKVLELATEGDDEFAGDWRFKVQNAAELARKFKKTGGKESKSTVAGVCVAFGMPRHRKGHALRKAGPQ